MDIKILEATLYSLAADKAPFKLYTRGGVISYAYLTRQPIFDTAQYQMLQLIGCADAIEGFADQTEVTFYVHFQDIVGLAMEMKATK